MTVRGLGGIGATLGLVLLAIGCATAIAGLYGFERARPGFADVV